MRRNALRVLGFTALGALALAALFDAAKLHGRYELPSIGLTFVPLTELAFYLWYAVWGGLATVCLGAALFGSLGAWCLSLLERCAARPRECVFAAGLFVFVGALLFHHLVLLGEPVTDDELVYQLSARNLALGRLTSAPPIAAEFLRNQFVVIDEARWHGKYPIGHSLLLAPFELLGRPDLLAPLLGAASSGLTYAVACRFAGARAALLATALLACSPHFVFTHGTLLSQTTSTLCMLLAVYASLRDSEQGRARWLVLMGATLGFLVLARPMPGLLVTVVVLTFKLHEVGRARLPTMLYAAAPLSAFMGLLLLVNHVQSGSPWSTGYAEVHGGYGALENHDGELSNSLGGAFVRENAWLFGWPCSLLFVPFARIVRWRAWFWSLLATALAYRALLPKTVVATTGPVYMTEIVPWLCMASAAGMVHAEQLLTRLGASRARARVSSLVLAAFAVALVGFAPTELRAIHHGARRRSNVLEQLEDLHIERALIFSNELVPPDEASTWAYYPPNPWPDLRDPILFVRLPSGPDALARAHALWRERFADRPALVFGAWSKGGLLQPLEPQRP